MIVQRPTRRLRSSVKAAYSTFASYKPAGELSVCHCDLCLEPGVESALLSTPLRQIPFRLLCEYTWALTGSDCKKLNADEIRHFLPRYLQFISHGLWPNFSGDWPPTLRALGSFSHRENWPSNEIEVIDEFFDALLQQMLLRPIGWSTREDGSPIPYTDVDELICTMAIAGGDTKRLIAEWSRNLTGTGLQHVAALIDDCERGQDLGIMRGPLPSVRWDYRSDDAMILKAWLYRTEIAYVMDHAAQEETDPLTKELFVRSSEAVLTAP